MDQIINFTPQAKKIDFNRIIKVFIGLTILALQPAAAQNAIPTAKVANDTIYVAPPTGKRGTDRENILTAIEKLQQGSIIKFAAGTYLVGKTISVKNSGITFLGHPEGTIIRGCNPDKFGDKGFAVENCNGFALTGGNQTVRDLKFEYTWHALILGGQPCEVENCPPGTSPVNLREGSYLIENNTFCQSQNGIRVVGQWQDPAVIRNNHFTNTYHAVVVNGMTAHILNNEISVPEPAQLPYTNHPGLAFMIGGWKEKGVPICDRFIISGNKINGHPDAIAIIVFEGGYCRKNIIRDNTIETTRVRFNSASTAINIRSSADSTVSGIPLALLNDVGFGKGIIEENLIKGNRIIGSEGLAIEVTSASNNRIVDNTIVQVILRDHYPGNTLFSKAPDWEEANGSGIWISTGSNHNKIANNTFEDIASAAVFIEGDSNRVEVVHPPDVRDLGSGNLVSRSDTITSLHAYESRFINAGGKRLHYLDFGGEGLPLVFVHSEGWDAHTYAAFAQRFTDTNRPGYGESGMLPDGFDVEAQAKSLINFLDALGIERAVFAGNSSPTVHLTCLAEHHPQRVAGVIYLAGLLTPWLGEVRESDPVGAGIMATRASIPDSTAQERYKAMISYRPKFLSGDRPPAGETTQAIESYRKSLELNPGSLSGGKLKELEKEE